LKSVWESRVTWGTPVQSFVFLGLLVFELEPMYVTSDGQTTDADHRLMPPPPPTWRGHNKYTRIGSACNMKITSDISHEKNLVYSC